MQASWSACRLVVWAGGRGAAPESNDELATVWSGVAVPRSGWELHPGVPLPGGGAGGGRVDPDAGRVGLAGRAQRRSGARGDRGEPAWLGRVALEGVRAVRPAARSCRGSRSARSRRQVRRRVGAMGSGVVRRGDDRRVAVGDAGHGHGVVREQPRATTVAVIGAVVEAIVSESLERVDLPAQPPRASRRTDLADTIVARMDGAAFPADRELAKETSRRLDQWTRSVTDPGRQPLVVRLDPPGAAAACGCSRFTPTPAGPSWSRSTPRSDRTAANGTRSSGLASQRMLPALDRSKPRDRGQVAMGQEEAWDFMSRLGPMLVRSVSTCGRPSCHVRSARPSLHMFTEARPGSTVGAQPAQQRVVERRVRRCRADRRRDRPPRPAGAADGPVTRPVGGHRPARSRTGSCRAGRARIGHGADRCRDPPPERRSRRVDARRSASSSTATAGPRRSSAARATPRSRSTSRPTASPERCGRIRPRRWRGSTSSTPTSSAAVSRSTWGWARHRPCSPISPAPLIRARVGHRTGRRGRQLGRGGRTVRARTCGCSCTTAPARATDVAVGEGDRRRRRRHHHLRHRGARRRRAGRCRVDHDGARRGAGDQEPGERNGPALRRILPAHAWRSPAHRSRTGSATCGRSSTSPTRAWSGRGPRSSPSSAGDAETGLRALNGILLFRRTKTEPEVAAELPGQDRRARPLHDDHRADRAVPSRARRPDRRRRPTRWRRGAAGAVLAAITALKQICNHPAAYHDDDAAAHRPVRQADPPRGDRRVGVRGRRAGADLHALRLVGTAPGRAPQRGHRASPIACYDGDLTPDRPATGWSTTFQDGRDRARWCCR